MLSLFRYRNSVKTAKQNSRQYVWGGGGGRKLSGGLIQTGSTMDTSLRAMVVTMVGREGGGGEGRGRRAAPAHKDCGKVARAQSRVCRGHRERSNRQVPGAAVVVQQGTQARNAALPHHVRRRVRQQADGFFFHRRQGRFAPPPRRTPSLNPFVQAAAAVCCLKISLLLPVFLLYFVGIKETNS